MDTPFNSIEFCAGYAGIHLGLKRAIPNLRVIAFSEIEAFAVANLVSKMEAGLLDSAPVWPDLKTFPSSSFHGLVDLLVAGFPCQPFSAAGKRNADSDPRHLFPYILDAAVKMEATSLLLENVEGIISSKLKGEGWNDPAGTSVLLHVLRELERVGYRATAGVFSAVEVGAPHQRKRVFILAHRHSSGTSRLGEVSRESGSTSETGIRSGSPKCCGEDVADLRSERCERGQRSRTTGEEGQPSGHAPERCTSWPSRPGEPQHCWEPQRVVDSRSSTQQRIPQPEGRIEDTEARQSGDSGELADSERQQLDRGSNRTRRRIRCESNSGEADRTTGDAQDDQCQTQSPLGRDSDGLTDRLDYAELYSTCDNRTDELRLLGNGVLPDTVTRAYPILKARLNL